MNNYEKIMLALFAIQHNAYGLHAVNEEMRAVNEKSLKDDFISQRCEGRDKLMEEVITKLAEIMEILGECLNGMDAVSGIDTELMKIPYDIVYGRKTPENYE